MRESDGGGGWCPRDWEHQVYVKVYPNVSFEGEGESLVTPSCSVGHYGAFLSFPTAGGKSSEMTLSTIYQNTGNDDTLYLLSSDGGDLLASTWGASTLVPSGLAGSDGSMMSAMCMVQIPTDNCTQAAQLPHMLLDQYGTWVPTADFAGRCWVRVSAQIYNDLSDYTMLADDTTTLLAQLSQQA